MSEEEIINVPGVTLWDEERRLKVSADLLAEEEANPLPMTPEEVIARIREARAREEAPRQCGGNCNCSCGKKNDAEPL